MVALPCPTRQKSCRANQIAESLSHDVNGMLITSARVEYCLLTLSGATFLSLLELMECYRRRISQDPFSITYLWPCCRSARAIDPLRFVRTRAFVVTLTWKITSDYIPLGQGSATLLTRPFLDFFRRRVWAQDYMFACHATLFSLMNYNRSLSQLHIDLSQKSLLQLN